MAAEGETSVRERRRALAAISGAVSQRSNRARGLKSGPDLEASEVRQSEAAGAGRNGGGGDRGERSRRESGGARNDDGFKDGSHCRRRSELRRERLALSDLRMANSVCEWEGRIDEDPN